MNETLEMFRDLNGTLQFGTGKTGFVDFDGKTFDTRHDKARLTGQLARVRDLMSDGRWRTLEEISAATGDPESSISARLRDLRKPQWGLYTIDRRRRTGGQHEYQMRGRGL